MNILFLANRFPYPPFRGDKLKIFNLAKQLSQRHNLFLITFIQDKQDYAHVPVLENYFREIRLVDLPGYKSGLNCILNTFSSDPLQVSYFKSKKLNTVLNDFLYSHDIDVIHTQHLRMSQYTSEIHSVKTILDLPDAYSLYWKRRCEMNSNFLLNAFEKREFKKVQSYESIIKKFDLTLVCSGEDKEHLMKEHSANNIEILHNGVDTDTFISSSHNYDLDDYITFSGNMSYYPNIDAALYFAKEIFPEVKKQFPKVKFRIAGQSPVKAINELQSDDIIVTGFVKSIQNEYSSSSLAVSPVRVGAGTMNKVLEPMAMGVPVLMSHVGFKGLGAEAGRDVLFAGNTDEFIAGAIRLLSDRALRQSIGESGKSLVLNNFSWETISLRLEEYCNKLLNTPSSNDILMRA